MVSKIPCYSRTRSKERTEMGTCNLPPPTLQLPPVPRTPLKKPAYLERRWIGTLGERISWKAVVFRESLRRHSSKVHGYGVTDGLRRWATFKTAESLFPLPWSTRVTRVIDVTPTRALTSVVKSPKVNDAASPHYSPA
ncbi:hypothetical protein AAG570_004496 [Ranatra chinensis]|uniref:Uncharacterized protein n=1 Tax=Ranatra chinensis TaxID=642074 RepID=A0ABD0YJ76_9HEMI